MPKKEFTPLPWETVVCQVHAKEGETLIVTNLRVVEWQKAVPYKQLPLDQIVNFGHDWYGNVDIQNAATTGLTGTNLGWITLRMKTVEDAERAIDALARVRLAVSSPGPPSDKVPEPQGAVRSEDGQWWWDGKAWQPVQR